MKATLTGKDLVLLLLYATCGSNTPNEPIRGRTRLAKMIYLFRKELWPKFRFDRVMPEHVLPEFIAWKFGPYSKQVFSDVEFLCNVGLVTTSGPPEPASPEEALELDYWSGSSAPDAWDGSGALEVGEYSEETFSLTDLGKRYVEEKELWATLSDEQRRSLEEFKRKMTRAPLRAILRYVYERYPESTTRSEIRQQVLG